MTGFLKKLKNSSRIILLIWSLLLGSVLVSLILGRWSLAFVSFVTLSLALAPLILASRFEISLPFPFLLATTGFIRNQGTV